MPAQDFDPIDESRRQWEEHGWTGEAEGMTFVISLMRSHQLLLGRIDTALKPHALTFARFELLRLLTFSSAGALPTSKISSRLQVHPASTTSAVDRLSADGLVRREPHPRDGRTTLVRITDAGRGLVDLATDSLNREIFSAIGLPDDELGAVNRILKQHRVVEGRRSTAP